jgi:CheY-like chemotaxis protein
MGLSVVHGIVQSCGGSISVESEVGRGTTFQIHLPRVLGEVEQDLADRGSIAGGNERILVVDDEDAQAQTVRIMLEHLGYKAAAESNSVKALEILRGDPEAFDLVITDQEMPHLSGAQLAEAVLRLRPDIPIVLCTGFSEIIDEDVASSMGIRVFILKPYSVREMAEAVRKALGSRR